MCHFSQADTAETEIAVVTARASANLASVVIPDGELLVFSHFCNPCFSSHKVFLLLLFRRFSEGNAHVFHKQFAFVVVVSGGNERNVHTVGFGRFFNINFRENIMFFNTQV